MGFQIQIWLPVMKQDIISYMLNVEDTRTKSMFIMHFGRQQLNREINDISVCLWNIIYYYENMAMTPIMKIIFQHSVPTATH